MGLFTVHFQRTSEVTAAVRRRWLQRSNQRRNGLRQGDCLPRVDTATPCVLCSRQRKSTSQWSQPIYSYAAEHEKHFLLTTCRSTISLSFTQTLLRGLSTPPPETGEYNSGQLVELYG
ncbi:hypothetical protein SDJN03_00417, partial [Cucurbita argyrosperma subsp. sororia]